MSAQIEPKEESTYYDEMEIMQGWVGKDVGNLYSIWGEPESITENVATLNCVYTWNAKVATPYGYVNLCRSIATDDRHMIKGWAMKMGTWDFYVPIKSGK